MGCTKFHKNNILSWILKENSSMLDFGLINSIKYENIQALNLLLDNPNNLNVNISDREWKTPLHYASLTKLLPIAQKLIRLGANVLAQDNFMRIPLHYAAKSNSWEIAKLLVDNGADFMSKTNAQKTPLHKAAEYNSVAVCQYLLSQGVQSNDYDLNGFTPLYLSALKNSSNVAECLLNYGEKRKKAKDITELTPLHCAARFNCKETFEILFMSKSFFLHDKDQFGLTPLIRTLIYYTFLKSLEANKVEYEEFLLFSGETFKTDETLTHNFYNELLERSKAIRNLFINESNSTDLAEEHSILYDYVKETNFESTHKEAFLEKMKDTIHELELSLKSILELEAEQEKIMERKKGYNYLFSSLNSTIHNLEYLMTEIEAPFEEAKSINNQNFISALDSIQKEAKTLLSECHTLLTIEIDINKDPPVSSFESISKRYLIIDEKREKLTDQIHREKVLSGPKPKRLAGW